MSQNRGKKRPATSTKENHHKQQKINTNNKKKKKSKSQKKPINKEQEEKKKIETDALLQKQAALKEICRKGKSRIATGGPKGDVTITMDEFVFAGREMLDGKDLKKLRKNIMNLNRAVEGWKRDADVPGTWTHAFLHRDQYNDKLPLTASKLSKIKDTFFCRNINSRGLTNYCELGKYGLSQANVRTCMELWRPFYSSAAGVDGLRHLIRSEYGKYSTMSSFEDIKEEIERLGNLVKSFFNQHYTTTITRTTNSSIFFSSVTFKGAALTVDETNVSEVIQTVFDELKSKYSFESINYHKFNRWEDYYHASTDLLKLLFRDNIALYVIKMEE